jgi:hypothetical protein
MRFGGKGCRWCGQQFMESGLEFFYGFANLNSAQCYARESSWLSEAIWRPQVHSHTIECQ